MNPPGQLLDLHNNQLCGSFGLDWSHRHAKFIHEWNNRASTIATGIALEDLRQVDPAYLHWYRNIT